MKLFKEILFLLKRIISRALKIIFRILPINYNKICVLTFGGKTLSDSPKYICESLRNKNKKIKFIIGVNQSFNCDVCLPNCLFCNINSLKWQFHLLTSCVWIDNFHKAFWKKRMKTLYINTWHGGGLIKKIERSVEECLSTEYVKIAKKDSSAVDYFLSDSKKSTEIIMNDFWFDGCVFESGLPRYYPLIKNQRESNIKIRKFFSISDDTKIILYAPTFRKNLSCDSYLSNISEVVLACEEKFGSTFIFLVRLHSNVSFMSEKYEKMLKHVINVTDYPDCEELLCSADVLISDYSSVLFDYLFTNHVRPAFRLILDEEEYENDRSTYFQKDLYPWSISHSIKELSNQIKTYDETAFKKRIDNYLKFLEIVPNENADDLCSSFILDYTKLKSKTKLKNRYIDYIYERKM